MKRLILLIMILLPVSVVAQDIGFESIMKEYSSKEDCTTINISNAIFESMNISINADAMYVISVENSVLIPAFKRQMAEVTAPLKLMMSVNSGDESVNIYLRSENNNIKEMIIITSEKDSCVAIRIVGDNLEINQIDSLMNII